MMKLTEIFDRKELSELLLKLLNVFELFTGDCSIINTIPRLMVRPNMLTMNWRAICVCSQVDDKMTGTISCP
jgi:hypothetical protein